MKKKNPSIYREIRIMTNQKTKRNKDAALVSFLLDKVVKEKYEIYCKNNGYNFSKRIRVLVEKDLGGEIINHNSNNKI